MKKQKVIRAVSEAGFYEALDTYLPDGWTVVPSTMRVFYFQEPMPQGVSGPCTLSFRGWAVVEKSVVGKSVKQIKKGKS